MCCIVALMGLIGPRIAFGFAWIFTRQVSQAFDGILVPLVGVIVLPWTSLMWAIAYAPGKQVGGLGVLVVLVGVLLDLSSYVGGRRSRRR